MICRTGRLFLLPIRPSLTAITSPSTLSRPRIPFCGNFGHVKALKNHMRSSISYWKICAKRDNAYHLCKSGRKFGMGSLLLASVVSGSFWCGPRIGHAMDDLSIRGDDHHLDFPEVSDSEEDPRSFLTFARKLLLPACLFVTLLTNWDHPILLAAKVIVLLIGSKPRPKSVYLFIEQLRSQIMNQQPFLYKFKSLYAKKVEVEDYGVLCLARVELRDQKFTLIGILGSWWIFRWSSCQGAFSILSNKVLQIFVRN